MEPKGRHRLERVMWGRYQGVAYSISIVESSMGGGGWINAKSVCLGSRKRILGWPSAWLILISVRI